MKVKEVAHRRKIEILKQRFIISGNP
jgi:hypothetical protein